MKLSQQHAFGTIFRPKYSSSVMLPLLLLQIGWTISAVSAYNNGLGLTPQMGWNPWNLFGCDISETLVKEIASSMVTSGLADLGYEYINLDDCWQVSRNTSGHIVEDRTKFPSGIGHLSEYIRKDLGLKFGLYSDSGLFTCQRRPGGLGFETQDAESYVEWQIDYLKYDNCYATGMGGGLHKRYRTMRDALNATAVAKNSKPIFYSLCEWGIGDPAKWAGEIGNSWRTTGDIQKNWNSILSCLDKNDEWHSMAGPGGWNDPDMLQIGTTTRRSRTTGAATTGAHLSIAEQRAHFTLWALVKAPLLLANDLREIPDEIFAIISNHEIIAVHQDPLGRQGYKRRSDGPEEVWAGDLANGDVAVVLFNRSEKPRYIAAEFADVLYPPAVAHRQSSLSASVRDLWLHADLGVFVDRFEIVVDPHDVVALRLSDWNETDHRREPSATA